MNNPVSFENTKTSNNYYSCKLLHESLLFHVKEQNIFSSIDIDFITKVGSFMMLMVSHRFILFITF